MEYVLGMPITGYCDRKKLDIRECLELFAQVCEGVQHAHQKAIIYRDLKPFNILVVELDGQPAHDDITPHRTAQASSTELILVKRWMNAK